MSRATDRPFDPDRDLDRCGECFALLKISDMAGHMDWHRYAAPVQRAGPLVDEQKRQQPLEETRRQMGT